MSDNASVTIVVLGALLIIASCDCYHKHQSTEQKRIDLKRLELQQQTTGTVGAQ